MGLWNLAWFEVCVWYYRLEEKFGVELRFRIMLISSSGWSHLTGNWMLPYTFMALLHIYCSLSIWSVTIGFSVQFESRPTNVLRVPVCILPSAWSMWIVCVNADFVDHGSQICGICESLSYYKNEVMVLSLCSYYLPQTHNLQQLTSELLESQKPVHLADNVSMLISSSFSAVVDLCWEKKTKYILCSKLRMKLKASLQQSQKDTLHCPWKVMADISIQCSAISLSSNCFHPWLIRLCSIILTNFNIHASLKC